jgi:hypothetical protein
MTKQQDILGRVTSTLPFKLASDVGASTSYQVPWILPGLIAKGAIVELSGYAKDGKTTFLLDQCYAITTGRSILGSPPESIGPVVYLTEENDTSFARGLSERGLAESDKFILLQLNDRDVSAKSWPEIIDGVVTTAMEVDAVFLVVDHISAWTRLEAEQENDAASVLKALKPLSKLAQEGVAVEYARHDRKSGGRTGKSGRGSSAFSGFADDLLHLEDPHNSSFPNDRVLSGHGRNISRWDDMTIRLTNEGFSKVGDGKLRNRDNLIEQIIPVLPRLDDTPILTSQIANALSVTNDNTLKRALEEMIVKGSATLFPDLGSNGRANGYTKATSVDPSP